MSKRLLKLPDECGRFSPTSRRVLNKWWLPESGYASRCPDMLNRRFISDFASVVGFFITLLVVCLCHSL